jgi:hypothetical protein
LHFKQQAVFLQTGCSIFECENFYSAIVPTLRKFCHQRSELFYPNWFPPISQASDCVKRQDVPASGSQPVGNFLVIRNLAAVYVESVKRRIVGNYIGGSTGNVAREISTSSCLLIPRFFHSFSKVGVRAVVRIAKGCDLGLKPILDSILGVTGFGYRVGLHLVLVMSKTVATNFMTVFDHLFQVCDVAFAAIDFPPIVFVDPRVMCWVLIGNQEKCGWYAVAVENGNGIVELAPKPIVESKGNN